MGKRHGSHPKVPLPETSCLPLPSDDRSSSAARAVNWHALRAGRGGQCQADDAWLKEEQGGDELRIDGFCGAGVPALGCCPWPQQWEPLARGMRPVAV
jgi:hypothetical protein